MRDHHSHRFPGESDAYRGARDKLLAREIELRAMVEQIAAARRELPAGGEVKIDYAIKRIHGPIHFAELFEDGMDTLIVYNFMYPRGGKACPSCTSFLNALNASAPEIGGRASVAVLAQEDAYELNVWAGMRGWQNLRMFSSGDCNFNADYHAEDADGNQFPLLHVFIRNARGIFHHWSSELMFMRFDDGEPRHLDQLWPLWNALDLLPRGRSV